MTEDCRDTIGKPCPEVETKIVDGELWLRSPSVMMGYYKDPETTAQVLQDGWYATGDLCREDADGYLRLVGRKKNIIILSNGENVSPEEIEAQLHSCPDVEEVLVGVEGDLICATVFVGSGSEEQVRSFVQRYNSQVPYYKQVQKLTFLDSPFEKTQVGKIIRRSVLGVN
jgi:long-chain acyl-CoA synthetase